MYKNEQGLKVGHDKITCVITCVFKLITKWSFIILPTQHCHCWLQWAATPAELLWMSAFPRAGKLTGNHTRLAAESVNNWCSQGRQRKSFMEQQSILFLFLLGGGKIILRLEFSPTTQFDAVSFQTLKGQGRDTPRRTFLVLYSVACARGGIGSTGQIVTPWQMRSVRLWNCSQSCKTDLLSTDELEPIHRDTLKITVVQT